jgi:GAF domain-containing protein
MTTSDIAERQLLQSIVEVARHVYSAAASSVFIVSRDTGELIFTAVSGEGEESLIGSRFPAGTGIAGWVAASGEPLILDDLADNVQFARDAAQSTGYVPDSIMAAPLLADGECLGVLEVLDRYHSSPAPGRELGDVALLGRLATQAALALTLLDRRVDRRPGANGGPSALEAMAAMQAMLTRWAGRAPAAIDPLAVTLLEASVDLLEGRRGN